MYKYRVLFTYVSPYKNIKCDRNVVHVCATTKEEAASFVENDIFASFKVKVNEVILEFYSKSQLVRNAKAKGYYHSGSAYEIPLNRIPFGKTVYIKTALVKVSLVEGNKPLVYNFPYKRVRLNYPEWMFKSIKE